MADAPVSTVLSYDLPVRRSYRLLHIVAALVSSIVIPFYYIGLVPDVSSFDTFDWDRGIPFSEALVGIVSVSPWTLLSDPYTSRQVWFFPVATIVLATFVLVHQTRWKLALALAAIVFPLFLTRNITIYLFSPLLIPVIPAALLGQCDGECWDEGYLAYGALGAWLSLWGSIALIILITQKRHRP